MVQRVATILILEHFMRGSSKDLIILWENTVKSKMVQNIWHVNHKNRKVATVIPIIVSINQSFENPVHYYLILGFLGFLGFLWLLEIHHNLYSYIFQIWCYNNKNIKSASYGWMDVAMYSACCIHDTVSPQYPGWDDVTSVRFKVWKLYLHKLTW